jgi:hypothetical protein
VSAGDFDVTGGVTTSGHGVVPSPVDHEAPTPDPLGLPLPPPPSPSFGAVIYSGSAPLTLQPGTYVGGIKITGSGPVTLAPGVYFMRGGGFAVTGKGSVTGSDVLIVNAPVSPLDTITLAGQGTVSLSAPPSLAAPYSRYAGIALFQDPASANPLSITGQQVVTVTGVVYAPAALVNITANAAVAINSGPGTMSLPPINGALIASDLKVQNFGVLTIKTDDPPAAAAGLGGGAVAKTGPADVHAVALNALISGGGVSGPGTLTDQAAMDQVAMSLAGNSDLFSGAIAAAKKKTS